MTNAYILLDTSGNLFTASDASTYTKSSLTTITTNGPANGVYLPFDPVNNQFLIPDNLGKVYKINFGATASNGTISAPASMRIPYTCEYKSSNGTLILCGQDTSLNAAIWYSTGFGSWTEVILAANASAVDIRYDSGANQWNCFVQTTSLFAGSIYYSQNDGISWTAATATTTGTGSIAQFLQVGGTNQILGLDALTASDSVYSTNGTSYTVEIVRNSGLTTIAGIGIQGFAYQASSGLFMVAGTQPSSGTNGIATTTTPGTANSWTLSNNPNGSMGIFGAIQGGGNWLIFGANFSTGPGLVLSTNGTSFTDISSHIIGTTSSIMAAGYGLISSAGDALWFGMTF